ncbi:hypothetical protein MTP10_31190 [Nonomuraea sp. 3-1Str]|uniref:hypothetical protein n=1 Tax=unclassified Nonomuraea TaxID=2593643 RepID=UPI0028604E5F|nr:hypothetical protein [Nonomuraea sp. 3-1Str]MDR8413185.1 hypothetical protein [Nonomuraea sp. 3-1Str]
MTRRSRLSRGLVTVAVAAATATSVLSPAPAMAAKSGCSVVPFTPSVKSHYSVVATNSASCKGRVRNVRVGVKLYQFKSGWYVADKKSVSWGTVAVSRTGYVQKWIHPVPERICYKYMTYAWATWTYADGNPGAAGLYSATKKLSPSRSC